MPTSKTSRQASKGNNHAYFESNLKAQLVAYDNSEKSSKSEKKTITNEW